MSERCTRAGLARGPSTLKIVRKPKARRIGLEVAERRMERRRVEKPDSRFLDAALHDGRGGIESHAERFEHVSRSHRRRGRAIAVLGDAHAGPRDREGRHRREVHRVQLVTAGAHEVDGIRTDGSGSRIHHGVNEARHLVGGLALGREGGEKLATSTPST